jgi:hypothetical protein
MEWLEKLDHISCNFPKKEENASLREDVLGKILFIVFVIENSNNSKPEFTRAVCIGRVWFYS